MELYALCSLSCKEACHWREVEVSVSTAQFPSPALVPVLGRMFPTLVDAERTTQGTILIKVYYRSRQVKVGLALRRRRRQRLFALLNAGYFNKMIKFNKFKLIYFMIKENKMD